MDNPIHAAQPNRATIAGMTPRVLRKLAIATVLLVVGLYFIPIITIIWLAAGLIDVLRNKRRNAMLFERYFMGNGIATFLLSPFNLLLDLICYPNKGVYRFEDLPADWRAELDSVLDVFRKRKNEIIAEIDETFESGRRGMYVYKYWGKDNPHDVAEFKRELRFIKTVAVSVFSGKESTTWHYGPMRLTLRVLYNLTPVRHDGIYIECQNQKHFWHDDPLYIFDDTLFHRSVNEYDARRYCGFMDIMRPTRFPGLLSGLISIVAVVIERRNSMLLKHWKIFRPAAKAGDAKSAAVRK